MWIYLVIILAVVLSGCASGPRNIQELKREDIRQSFSSGQNYQKTYRDFKETFERCRGLDSSLIKLSTIESDIYTDIGEGRITIYLTPSIGDKTPMTYINIKNDTNNTSVIDVYYRWKDGIKEQGPTYQRWAKGDLSCD